MGWTTITADTSWQELSIAQEIATAYNKRVAALSETERTDAEVDEIKPSDAMTVFDFVHAVQTGIEAMARYWGDKDRVLINVSPDTLSFTNFSSVSEMMTAAGLTQPGYWRRIEEGGTQPEDWESYTATGWSYGKITDKDLAGPWLFIDLQVALSALTRRYSDGPYAVPVSWKGYHASFDYGPLQGSTPSPGGLTWETGYGVDGYSVYKYMENNTSNPVDPSACFWILELSAAYRECTITDMSSEEKTVTLYGYYTFIRLAMLSNSSVSPSWTPGMGIGLGELSEGDGLVVALSEYTGTDTSTTLLSCPALGSWSIEGYVPWPATTSTNGQSSSFETIVVNVLFPVIDYQFDP